MVVVGVTDQVGKNFPQYDSSPFSMGLAERSLDNPVIPYSISSLLLHSSVKQTIVLLPSFSDEVYTFLIHPCSLISCSSPLFLVSSMPFGCHCEVVSNLNTFYIHPGDEHCVMIEHYLFIVREHKY